MKDMQNDAEGQRAGGRPGIYARGSDTVDTILKAAAHVLVEEGASAFTLRRIADECGLKVGNVSAHFPRKEMLVQVLLEELITSAEDLIEKSFSLNDIPAEEALTIIITGILDDIALKRTTHLFIELWAMANHNDFVADRLEDLYRYMIDLIASCVKQLNPALGPKDVASVALFITGSLEGATVLSGYGKPWESQMPQLGAIAVQSFIHLVKTITPEDIRAGMRANKKLSKWRPRL
jgi:AcrR family transcriptional regulator